MSYRDILTITPLSLLWYRDNEGDIIVQHFYTKRKIVLEEERNRLFWSLISEYSDMDIISEEFLKSFTEEDLENTIKLFYKLGIIKIYKK